MIEIDGVSKSFDGARVLHDLDLTVGTGETVALLGPSGVGKSTLLRIVAGLEVPDHGSVRMDGVDLDGTPTHRRGIGYMFQDLALFPHFDVAANVAFGLRMQGVERRERARRVTELLSLVGLAGSDRRDPASLSGGERQRVALARALAPRPAALLLDEPFGALDRTLRDRLLVELRSIFDELGLTVIAVTHDPTEAAALADRVAVMLSGDIVQAGPPAELYAAPADRRVAGTLGLRNVLDGAVRDGEVVVDGWGAFATQMAGASGGVLVPRRAIRPGGHDGVEVVIEDVVLRDGQPLRVVRPVAGGPELEADLPDVLPGERRFVAIDHRSVRPLA